MSDAADDALFDIDAENADAVWHALQWETGDQITDEKGNHYCEDCEDCGETIPPERIKARPDATRCVECQEAHELENRR